MSINEKKYNSHNKDQEFDLDEYIAANAQADNSGEFPKEHAQERSSFLKNAAIVSIFAFLVFLGSNGWNFKEAFGFGEPSQDQNIVVNTGQTPQIIVEKPTSITNQAQVLTINEGKLAAELEALEELESINTIVEASLAETLEGLEQLENLENLSDLSSLSKLSALGELGNLAELSSLSELAELGDLEAITDLNIGDGITVIVFPSFEEYAASVKTISDFTDADIQKMYNANIPFKFAERMIKGSESTTLSADDIIKKFEQDQ